MCKYSNSQMKMSHYARVSCENWNEYLPKLSTFRSAASTLFVWLSILFSWFDLLSQPKINKWKQQTCITIPEFCPSESYRKWCVDSFISSLQKNVCISVFRNILFFFFRLIIPIPRFFTCAMYHNFCYKTLHIRRICVWLHLLLFFVIGIFWGYQTNWKP